MSSLSRNILGVYYENVITLADYLTITLPSCFSSLRVESAEHVGRLIRTTFVANSSSDISSVRFNVHKADVHMRDVIRQAQRRIFDKARARPSNVLIEGYKNNSQLTNIFVNTVVYALQSRDWEALLQLVGVDPILYLLTETCVFVALPNDCLCQMTGAPIIHMPRPTLNISFPTSPGTVKHEPGSLGVKRKAPEPLPPARPIKRIRTYDSITTSKIMLRKDESVLVKSTPVDIIFIRARMFYAKAKYIPKKRKIAVGLPPKHIFNVLLPSFDEQSASSDVGQRIQATNARTLSKHIFPRQYGRGNAFEMWVKNGQEQYTHYNNAVEGSCKTPKRLKEILPLLDKMIWRHGKCGYVQLRNIACPSKVREYTGDKKLDSSIILEYISEHSIELTSQARHTTMRNISLNSHLTNLSDLSRENSKPKPRFAEFVCSHIEVYNYLVLVTEAVIPKAFWGCQRNFRIILQSIKKLVHLRRYESFTLHSVLQNFSTTECDWLAPPANRDQSSRRHYRIPLTDTLKRREILEEFMFWFFDGFLIPILQTTFYVTESTAFRNQVLYFRQDDWVTLCAPLLERLTSVTFEKMQDSEVQEMMRQRKLGFSFVRLLPKEVGVRPIVNLRKKVHFSGRGDQSINQILQATFQILTYEKSRQSERLGASIFGYRDLHQKLLEFKQRLNLSSKNTHSPKLYFVKLDVEACFDTIEQTKLLDILKELISEENYILLRHGEIGAKSGKIRRQYMKKAVSEDEQPSFLDYATELAAALRSTIFVDMVSYPTSTRHNILALLEEHITHNVVKFGKHYYRQIVGIPQGSVLSTLLCSFFYGDLERQHHYYTMDPAGLLLRLVDDYLYITTDKSKAIRFLNMMYKGHPEYGCFVSKAKTLTNFEHPDHVVNVIDRQKRRFPWCGYLIDMSDLSTSVDYSRYIDIHLSNTITIGAGQHPVTKFFDKMCRLFKRRNQVIFFDPRLNSEDVIYKNIYQSFLITAMKMNSYLRSLNSLGKVRIRSLSDSILRIIQISTITVMKTFEKHLLNQNPGFQINKRFVNWLGLHAFHTVVRRKPTGHIAVLKALTFALSMAKHNSLRRRFRHIVKEGWADMSPISY